MPLTANNKIRYEFDPTGINPDNLVSNERHTTSQRQVKVIVPRHNAFYGDSLVVTDVTTGQRVSPANIKLEDPSTNVSLHTGKQGFHSILIVGHDVSTEFEISYQVVGGDYSIEKTEIIYDKFNTIDLNNRPIDWVNIRNKPSEYNPAEHLHKLEEIFGVGHLTYVIERLVQAHLIGDEASHDAIYAELDRVVKLLEKTQGDMTTYINTVVNTHIANDENPHNVTAEQVGTYTKLVIDNKINAVKTLVDTHSGRQDNPHNVTAAQVGAYTKVETNTLISESETRVTNLLNTHKNDKNNPHKVTATQVGAYTKAETDTRINNVNTALTAHTSNYNNPHKVTATQVGAYTKTETTNLITAAENRSKALLDTHKQDYKNPHKVTAAQVGAYTKAEADAKVAVVNTALTAHKNDKNNPHKVTAAQVGAPTTAQMTAAIASAKTEMQTYVNNELKKYFANGKLVTSAIPISTTSGNEVSVNGNGIYFNSTSSNYAKTYGMVERTTYQGIKGVRWRNFANTESYILFPSTFV